MNRQLDPSHGTGSRNSVLDAMCANQKPMRWLGLLAILIAGAAIYLLSMMSGGATATTRDRPRPAAEIAVEVERGSSDNKPVAVAPVKPIVPARPEPKPSAPARVEDRSVAPAMEVTKAPADASEEEVPWTEQERWQKLWAVSGRYEKGNYPGSVELAMEVARRYPPWQEDAWKVAVQAHCAMNEPDKANALFAKITDASAIEEITKSCTAWNVKLNKSK